jgi:DNA-binding MarR family transcriptional regulator
MLTNIPHHTLAQGGEDRLPRPKLTADSLRMAGHGPAEQAADRIHSAAIHLLRTLRREDARLGVGPAGLSVLSILVFGGPKTMGALAAAEQVKLPTMSRLVKTLERWGMVHREPDPADRRRTVVRATSTGGTVMRRGRDRRVLALARRMERCTPEEIAVLNRAAELIERVSKGEALA